MANEIIIIIIKSKMGVNSIIIICMCVHVHDATASTNGTVQLHMYLEGKLKFHSLKCSFLFSGAAATLSTGVQGSRMI